MPTTLNILVSGTPLDLQHEREAIARALNWLKVEAARLQVEFSKDHSTRDQSLQKVRACDIYLGIYNQTRYGQVMTQDSLTVTELEFNEAQRLYKPTLIFVKTLHTWTSKDNEEKAQYEKQTAFLQRVREFANDRFPVVEFERLPQLETQATNAVASLLRQHFDLTATQPPFQVPPDREHFVGRETQIQTLTDALTHDSNPNLIVGDLGMGKRALAIHLAHRLRAHFDGGVLWANIPTLHPANQLSAWARAFGNETISHIQNLDERAQALHHLLAGRRILAILDSAAHENDDAKIDLLLKALANCAVIVTSCTPRLASLQNTRRLDLVPFTAQETASLFERIVGPTRLAAQHETIQHIGQIVDFRPLALELTATQLQMQKTWTPETLRDELLHTSAPHGIRAACEVSYTTLTPDEQTFFATLGAFAGEDWDTHAAAQVSGTNETQVSVWLEKLLRLAMVQEGRAFGRYCLHPIWRDFARTHCVTLAAANQRMAKYYGALAQENSEKINNATRTTLAVLDLELSNITAAQHWARTQYEAEGWRLMRTCAGAMSNYFNARGQWDTWLDWSKAGLIACQHLVDEDDQGLMFINIGLAHQCLGAYDEALAAFVESRVIYTRQGNQAALAKTFNHIGQIYQLKGAYNEALASYAKSRTLATRNQDETLLAQILYNIGQVQQLQGTYDEALATYTESRELAKRIEDTGGAIRTLGNIAEIQRLKGNYEAALAAYAESRTLCDCLDDTTLLVKTLNNIGEIQRQQGAYDAVLATCTESRALAERIGDVAGLIRTLGNIGLAHALRAEYEAAREAFMKGYTLEEQLGDASGLAVMLNNLGIVHALEGNTDAALAAYAQSRAVCEQIGDWAGLAQTLNNIGSLYYNQGEYAAALTAFSNSRTLKEQLKDTAGLARTMHNIGLIQKAQGTDETALATFTESRTLFEQIGDMSGLDESLWNLAFIYEKQERLDEAWALMEQAISIERQHGLGDLSTSEKYLQLSRAQAKGEKTSMLEKLRKNLSRK